MKRPILYAFVAGTLAASCLPAPAAKVLLVDKGNNSVGLVDTSTNPWTTTPLDVDAVVEIGGDGGPNPPPPKPEPPKPDETLEKKVTRWAKSVNRPAEAASIAEMVKQISEKFSSSSQPVIRQSLQLALNMLIGGFQEPGLWKDFRKNLDTELDKLVDAGKLNSDALLEIEAGLRVAGMVLGDDGTMQAVEPMIDIDRIARIIEIVMRIIEILRDLFGNR